MPIGCRILKRKRAVSADVVERFRAIAVANVSDSMSRLTAGGPRLRPMHSGGVMAGPALTVKAWPGDNLFIHKAVDMASPGDIIVVDAGGDLTNALIGDLMAAHAMKRQVGGMVINGSIRDTASIRRDDMPVYAAGVTHRGPTKNGPGEINVAIAIDGMVIEPGDLIIGDNDGMLCVPFELAEEIYVAAKAQQDKEVRLLAEFRAGTNNRSWVDQALAKIGCTIES